MLNYIFRLSIIILIFAPVYLLIRKPWRREKKRELLLMFFWLFNAALLTLALEGDYRMPVDMVCDAIRRLASGDGINIVPFRTIAGFFRNFDADRFLVNIVGNIVMFVPWGFGLVLLWERNRRPLRIAGLSFAITAFIEFCQLFIDRAVDVDDMILNFTGSMLGVLIWYALRNTKPLVSLSESGIKDDSTERTDAENRVETRRTLKRTCGCLAFGLFISFVLPLGCYSACSACVGDPEGDGVGHYAIDEDIDRLLVLPFDYFTPDETRCLMIDSKGSIRSWKNSHKWTDSYAICCDEDTTHEIIAFNGFDEVRDASYSSYKMYSNLEFNLMQSILVSRMETSAEPQWQYVMIASEDMDFEALRDMLYEQEGWFAYDSYCRDGEMSFKLVTPSRLSENERQAAADKYGFEFALDGGEE